MRTRVRSKITLLFMSLGLLLAVPAVALASDVNVAVVDVDVAPANSTDLKPGATQNITINMSVTGAQAGNATFEVYRDWTLENGTLTGSNAVEFPVPGPRTGSTPALNFSTPGTITVDDSQSDGSFTLAAQAFDITNSNSTGAKLVAGTASNYVVKVDGTKPSISLLKPLDGDSYNVGDSVTVDYSCSDSGSGIKSCVGNLNDGATLDTSTPGSYTFTVNAEDKVGNKESVTHNYTVVSPDSVAPTSSHELSSLANVNGWHNQNVTVTLDAEDNAGGSGVDEIRYSINGGASAVYDPANKPVISTEGTTTFSYYAVDNNNNEETPANSFDIKLDKTAPSVAYKSASPAANAAGWNNTNVTATFEATDQLSGMGATDADKTATGTAIASTEGTNVTVGSPAFTDRAGNPAPAGTATSDGFKIDKSKPVASVTGVSNGATYTTGNVPTPGCDTQDQPGLSGVKTNATLSVTGGTGGFGNLTATCSGAVDNADNAQAAPVSVTYSVSAAFDGFLQPIDGHSVNTGKYGRTYPIKWQLRDSSGALISDSAAQLLVGTMTGGQKAVSCTSFDLSDTDALESAVTGNTALRYDATSDQFIYNYKAPSSGSCYVFAIRNADGLTTQQIDFKFTK